MPPTATTDSPGAYNHPNAVLALNRTGPLASVSRVIRYLVSVLTRTAAGNTPEPQR